MAIDRGARDEQPEDLETVLDTLEQKLDRLKILYEQYFMGIEKLEPQVPHKEVTRILHHLQKLQIRNTGLRFRYRNLVQRYNVYLTHWNRVLREIEAGTYVRDVLRAQRNAEKRGVEFPAEELGVKARRRRREEPARENQTAASRSDAEPPATAPSAAIPGGMTEEQVERLFRRLVHARKLCGENVAGLKREVLIATIRKQVPAIMAQHQCSAVEFTVVIKNEKAILKAIPKK